MEVTAASGSSDALTLALNQERQKAKEKMNEKFRSRNEIRNRRVRVKSSSRRKLEKEFSEDKGQDNATRFCMPLTPVKRSYSRTEESSPGGTMTSASSEVSETSKAERAVIRKVPTALSAKAKQGVGYMKSLLVKKRSSRVPKTVDTNRLIGAESILRDLDIHSVGTSTVRHRNTKKPEIRPEDSADPTILLARARRYKIKAQHLLQKAGAVDAESKEPGKKVDPRDIEALARKAFRYATESRRLFDLVRKKIELEKSEVSDGVSDCGASSTTANSVIEGYSPPIPDDNVSAYSTYTSFSQKVERDEHRRKMKELELFGEVDFGPFSCVAREDLGQEYANETKIIVQSLQNTTSASSDSVSVMSPVTIVSQESIVTESSAHRLHAEKMKELELFSASNTVESWKSWINNLWARRNTIREVDESRVEIEEEEDDAADNGAVPADDEVLFPLGGYCGQAKYPQILEDDFDEIIIHGQRHHICHTQEYEDDDTTHDARETLFSEHESDSGSATSYSDDVDGSAVSSDSSSVDPSDDDSEYDHRSDLLSSDESETESSDASGDESRRGTFRFW